MSFSLATSLWSFYQESLESSPLLTKCLTSFVGFILGDAIAQLPLRGARFDVPRTARFALFGFLVHAPAGSAWYSLLDVSVFPSQPTSWQAVVAKTLLDQVFYTPFSLLVFYVVLRTMEGRRRMIGETLREKYRPTLLAGYTIWPLAHVINFALVPGELRLLYVNVVQIFWNVILCRLAASKAPVPGSPEAKSRGAPKKGREKGRASSKSGAVVTVDLEEGPSWLGGAGKGVKEQRPSQNAKYAALRQQSGVLRQQSSRSL